MGSSPNMFNSGGPAPASGAGSSASSSSMVPGTATSQGSQQGATQMYPTTGTQYQQPGWGQTPQTTNGVAPSYFYGNSPGQYPLDRAVSGLGFSNDYLNQYAQQHGYEDFGRMSYNQAQQASNSGLASPLFPIAPPSSHFTSFGDFLNTATSPGGLQNRPGYDSTPSMNGSLPGYYTNDLNNPSRPLMNVPNQISTSYTGGVTPPQIPGGNALLNSQGGLNTNFLSQLLAGVRPNPATQHPIMSASPTMQGTYRPPPGSPQSVMSLYPGAGNANLPYGNDVSGGPSMAPNLSGNTPTAAPAASGGASNTLSDWLASLATPGAGYGAAPGANASNNWVPEGGNWQMYDGMPYPGGMGPYSGWLPNDPSGPSSVYGTPENPAASPLAAAVAARGGSLV